MVRQGLAGKARRVEACLDEARRVKVRQFGYIGARRGQVRCGLVWQARWVMAVYGKSSRGKFWQLGLGYAWHVSVGFGLVRLGRRGWVRFVMLRRVTVW